MANPGLDLETHLRIYELRRQGAYIRQIARALGISYGVDKTRVAIVSGSLQVNSGFGKRYYSLTTHPVFPIIVFHPDRHLMVPYWSVKEWLSCSGA